MPSAVQQKTVTLDEMLAELKREHAIRANVYPKWAKSGKKKAEDLEEHQARLGAAIKALIELGQFGRITQAEFDGSGMPIRVLVRHVDGEVWYQRQNETE